MQTGSELGARRCPDCGALASPDAEWCGQCFRSLVDPDREPEPERDREPETEPSPQHATVAAARAAAPGDSPVSPVWPCPACGNENPIELDACAVCGTTFAALMRRDDAPPKVDPTDALKASLVFPGLGHRKVGRGLDGLARGVLFAVLAAMAATMFISGVTTSGTFGVFAVFLGAALLVYVGSAFEAYRLADGGQPFVSSRALLWATVVVVLGSVLLLAISVVTVARR
jgi:hypothetical protein